METSPVPQVTSVGTSKAILLLAAAFAHYIGFRPPHPPASKGDKVYRGQLFEHVVMAFVHTVRVAVTTLCLIQAALVLLLQHARPYVSYELPPYLCAHPSSHLTILAVPSPLFVIGVCTITAGALLRYWCYATLGEKFTYLITVKPAHALITSGPYAYVRHPSYTGVLLILLGCAMAFFSPGNYIAECGLMRTPFAWVVRAWFLCSAFSLVSLYKRGMVEDKLLRATFQEDWIAYSRLVTKRFIPGII